MRLQYLFVECFFFPLKRVYHRAKKRLIGCKAQKSLPFLINQIVQKRHYTRNCDIFLPVHFQLGCCTRLLSAQRWWLGLSWVGESRATSAGKFSLLTRRDFDLCSLQVARSAMPAKSKSSSHATARGEHEKLVSMSVEKAPLVAKTTGISSTAPVHLFLLDVPHVCSCSCFSLNIVAVAALKNLAYATVWIALSASVILFNKYILAFGGFPFPITLTVWHMLFSSSLASALVWTGAVPSTEGMDSKRYVSAIMPIGALFAGTLWLGNAAYLHLSVSFIQMLKALMPAAVYAVGCLFSTETFAWKCVANMVIITVGVALASAGEVALVPVGVAMQLGSVLTESTRLALVQILLQRRALKLNPITTLYYVAPASGFFLIIPWSVLEAEELWNGFHAGEITIAPMLLVANAACAFALNLSVFLLIGKTSALTMNVAGVIKDWLLIALSSLLFHSKVTPLNVQGYGVAFAGVCWYNWTKLKVMNEAPGAALGATRDVNGDDDEKR